MGVHKLGKPDTLSCLIKITSSLVHKLNIHFENSGYFLVLVFLMAEIVREQVTVYL